MPDVKCHTFCGGGGGGGACGRARSIAVVAKNANPNHDCAGGGRNEQRWRKEGERRNGNLDMTPAKNERPRVGWVHGGEASSRSSSVTGNARDAADAHNASGGAGIRQQQDGRGRRRRRRRRGPVLYCHARTARMRPVQLKCQASCRTKEDRYG